MPNRGTLPSQARGVMMLLDYVARHGGVTPAELTDHLAIAQPTLYRWLREIRAAYGASITWDRRNREYVLRSWGVFDARSVRQFLKKTGR